MTEDDIKLKYAEELMEKESDYQQACHQIFLLQNMVSRLKESEQTLKGLLQESAHWHCTCGITVVDAMARVGSTPVFHRHYANCLRERLIGVLGLPDYAKKALEGQND